MASKQLTANVRLNSRQAEQKLRNIAKAIDAINRATGKQTNAYAQVNTALNKTVKLKAKVNQETNKTATSTKKWANALNVVNGKLNGSKSLISSIGSKLKTLAGTYLGVMGMRTVVNTSDAITSAENKLNYINGGDTALTEDTMNKMYASAQKVRMGYTDMMSNVSKSMALAGDAFNNSTDAAIRFQEIMAEAYAVGGASAQEMSSSMYQLIQALGAGTLAGDELRSVREGAPLAYKEIEKFAQGVYNTEESLKDLASQGKITSEMVVQAITNAGNKMDSAFAQTEQTFAQTWAQIKNAATRAFLPVAKMLRNALNKAIDNGLIQKFETFFINIAKGVMIVFKIIENVITWVVNNWGWLQHVVIAGLMLMITWTIIKAGISIACAYMELKAWMLANSVTWATIGTLARVLGVIAIIIMAIMGLIYVFYLWKTAAIDTCQAITIALLIVAAAILLIGIITGNVVMIIIGIVMILLGVIFYFFEEVCYGAAWLTAWIINIVFAIVNFILACINVIIAFFYNLVADIVNGVVGICNVIGAVCQNIAIAFENAWNGALSAFWNFIADCIEGLDWLAKPLEAIAELFGESFDAGSFAGDVRAKANKYKQKEYVSISNAWSDGWNTMDRMSYANAWNSGMGALNYVDANAWGSAAGNWGAGVKDAINKWGSQFQNGGENGSGIDNMMNSLGLNPGEFDNLFGGSGVGNDPGNLLGNVGDIADDTGKIADSMELTEEDLKHLRSIAEMEWKKEYTTANINIDMTNNNNINGESDLDGIVTKLSEKLYEELNIIADGVYAY